MIRADRLLADLEALAAFGSTGAGVDRPCYSPAYRGAVDWLAERMRQVGMAVSEDSAGNVIGRLGPATGAAVACGSHIDSVPGGGRYDGTLGVLAGLEVARCLAESGSILPKAFEVIAFADEEGAFLSELGARAMIGDMPVVELRGATGRDGTERLTDAMRAYGLDPSRVSEAARPRDAISAYVELHIEQGPVLERGGVDIGIVQAIAGQLVSEFTFLGEANHAGTTPVPLRKDAFRAAAQTVTEGFMRLRDEFPADARLTYGAVEIEPGAANVVPSVTRLRQEIRAGDEHTIDRLYGVTQDLATAAAGECGVTVESAVLSRDAAACMSGRLQAVISAAADDIGCSWMALSSGAGHDAQVLARAFECGMIFIPSAGGLSHNPAEFSSPSQIATGAKVLNRTIRRLLGLEA